MQDCKDCFTNLLCCVNKAMHDVAYYWLHHVWESPNLWRVLIWYLIIFTDLFWWNLILKTVTNFIFCKKLFMAFYYYAILHNSFIYVKLWQLTYYREGSLIWVEKTWQGWVIFQPNQSVNILWVCTKLKSSIENPLLKVEIKC